MSACNPDRAPVVWLCSGVGAIADIAPAWMTESESQRLGRLTGTSRCDFLASRWLIRKALARVSGLDALACRPADGRPDASGQPPGWRLSLSHSGGMAGCAVSPGAVGLDIEPLARRPQWQKVVERWFAPEEQAWLLAGNNPDHFLKAWTLKEAWLKATGRGIANNLQTLRIAEDFTLQGDQPGQDWQASLGKKTGFLVAVVYQGPQPPSGFMLSGQIDISNPAARAPGKSAIEWTFHRKIQAASN